VDVNDDILDCAELDDAATLAARQAQWQAVAERNGGTHPLVRPADTRLLRRMRTRALPPAPGRRAVPGLTPGTRSAGRLLEASRFSRRISRYRGKVSANSGIVFRTRNER